MTGATLPAGRVLAHEGSARAPVIPPREVAIAEGIPAEQIHVTPDEFALYWTLPGARALRYAVEMGRDDLYEAGTFLIQAKKEWPSWTPTPGMLEHEPVAYGNWEDGMPGGIDNLLGARALYLFKNGYDTFLRIYGTNASSIIRTAVSNGSARLVNDQIIDLYERGFPQIVLVDFVL